MFGDFRNIIHNPFAKSLKFWICMSPVVFCRRACASNGFEPQPHWDESEVLSTSGVHAASQVQFRVWTAQSSGEIWRGRIWIWFAILLVWLIWQIIVYSSYMHMHLLEQKNKWWKFLLFIMETRTEIFSWQWFVNLVNFEAKPNNANSANIFCWVVT